MTEKKITKVEKFEMLLAINEVAENEMLVEFINHEMELIKKKNAYKSVNKKKVAENEELVKEILDVFYNNPQLIMTCTDIVRHLNFKYSTQKLSPQLKKMVENKILKGTIEKKVKHYSLA